MSDDDQLNETVFTDKEYDELKARVRLNAERIKGHSGYERAAAYADAAMEKHKAVAAEVDADTIFGLRTLIIGAYLGGYNGCLQMLKEVIK